MENCKGVGGINDCSQGLYAVCLRGLTETTLRT